MIQVSSLSCPGLVTDTINLSQHSFLLSLNSTLETFLIAFEMDQASLVVDSQESTSNAGDLGLIPGLGRSPGGGSGNPLQYACWEIPWTEEPQGLQSRGHKKLDMTEVT